MKIEYAYNKSMKTTEAADTKKITRATPEKPDVPEHSAEVQLSSMTTRMQAAETALGKTSNFDQKRVDELRIAIAEGRFKINPEAIAERLLQSVGELLGARATLESKV